jgi:hypothetical protein
MKTFVEKYAGIATTIGTMLAAFYWMHGNFKDIDNRFVTIENRMESRFTSIERELADIRQEVAIIKTVMIMKNILPQELAKVEE